MINPHHWKRPVRTASGNYISDFNDGAVEDDDGIDVSNIITGSRTRTQHRSYVEDEDEDEDENEELEEEDEERVLEQ